MTKEDTNQMINTEKTMEAMKDSMIGWAMKYVGRKDYVGWCLSFVEDAVEQSNGIEIFGGDSAKESYLLYRDALHTGVPEHGSVVFYDCLCHTPEGVMDWGHCGIALEDGRAIHAWDRVRIDPYREIENLSAFGEHPVYLGWVTLERILAQKP